MQHLRWKVRFELVSNQSAFALIAALTMYVVTSGCNGPDLSSLSQIQARRPAVPLEQFLFLEGGMTKSAVDRLLGTNGEHQFTELRDDGHVYSMFFYEVAPAPDSEFRYSFDLLFKDQSLFAVLDINDEFAHFKSLPVDSPARASQKPTDDAWIQEFLRIKSWRGNDIAKQRQFIRERVLNEERAWRNVTQNSNANAGLAAVVASSGLDPDRIKREYEINAEQLKRFDPEKVIVGMTKEEVNRLFGHPKVSEDLDGSLRIGLYGPDVQRTVNPDVVCSPIAVVFRDNSVVRVLSHRAFENKWFKAYGGGESSSKLHPYSDSSVQDAR